MLVFRILIASIIQGSCFALLDTASAYVKNGGKDTIIGPTIFQPTTPQVCSWKVFDSPPIDANDLQSHITKDLIEAYGFKRTWICFEQVQTQGLNEKSRGQLTDRLKEVNGKGVTFRNLVMRPLRLK